MKLVRSLYWRWKLINSDFLNGLDIKAKEKIIIEIEKKNRKKKTFIQIKRLGYFQTTLLGMSNSNDLLRRWIS